MPVRRTRIAPPPVAVPERRWFLARIGAAVAGLALAGRARPAEAATAGLNPFIGEIMLFAADFAPDGWALCNGQILSIAQNIALFQLLGTRYGGNGTSTFALPDLRGRAPIHFGQGPGLSNYDQGTPGGVENHQLSLIEMPSHSHLAYAHATNGTTDSPVNAMPARNPAAVPAYGTSATATLAANHLGNAGSNQPHPNMQPYLVLNYCIALEGVFPQQQ